MARMPALASRAPALPRVAPLRRRPLRTSLLRYTLQTCSVQRMTELTVRQARELLTAWAADHALVMRRRDEVVRAAVDAGVSKSEIHRLTGIARTTIDRITGSARAQAEEGAAK
jgi:hypothetical protein